MPQQSDPLLVERRGLKTLQLSAHAYYLEAIDSLSCQIVLKHHVKQGEGMEPQAHALSKEPEQPQLESQTIDVVRHHHRGHGGMKSKLLCPLSGDDGGTCKKILPVELRKPWYVNRIS